jgi:type I site-specific restriction endonuclease
MLKLNLPQYSFRYGKKNDKLTIYDIIRKKYVVLTPEEWVRQNFLKYLIEEKHFPVGLLAVEMELRHNELVLRADITAYGKNGFPIIIVECKAPSIKISQAGFDQVAVYSMKLGVGLVVVTNGVVHYCCRINHADKRYDFLKEVPDFRDLAWE